MPLDFAPEWLTFTGPTLTAGHADGAVSFSVGAEVDPDNAGWQHEVVRRGCRANRAPGQCDT